MCRPRARGRVPTVLYCSSLLLQLRLQPSQPPIAAFYGANDRMRGCPCDSSGDSGESWKAVNELSGTVVQPMEGAAFEGPDAATPMFMSDAVKKRKTQRIPVTSRRS